MPNTIYILIKGRIEKIIVDRVISLDHELIGRCLMLHDHYFRYFMLRTSLQTIN